MSKRILAFVFASVAVALAACNNGNPNNLYGVATATPVPTSTASPSPNPSASTAVVTVYFSASPVPNQPVTLSSSVNGSIGTQILTQNTNNSGQTTFSKLTPTVTYCFSSTFTPPGSLARTQTQCTPYWGSIGVTLSF